MKILKVRSVKIVLAILLGTLVCVPIKLLVFNNIPTSDNHLKGTIIEVFSFFIFVLLSYAIYHGLNRIYDR